MNKLSYMLDFLVVASTFEFVTHLSSKYLKPIEKQNYKSKKENNKRKKGEERLHWAENHHLSPPGSPFAQPIFHSALFCGPR
jgi:hypothetical protein